MRRILDYEVKAAAAALAKLPCEERKRMCELWIHQAEWSHKYMKKHAKPHPVWGNGSLLQALHIQDFDAFSFSNSDHCSAMETVLNCLVARNSRHFSRKHN